MSRVHPLFLPPPLLTRSFSARLRVPFLSEHALPSKAKRETWVDGENDPREGAKKLKTAVANPDVPGGVSETDAQKEAAKGVFPGGGSTLYVFLLFRSSVPLHSTLLWPTQSFPFSCPPHASRSSAPTPTPSFSSSAPKPSSSSAPPSATPSFSSKYTESSIQTLIDLGVTRDQAIGYLDMANGNVDLAASFLF